MDDKKYRENLADMGLEQFVRNVITDTLKEYVGKPEKTDEVISEMNKRLMEQFRDKVKIISKKVFDQMKTLLQNQTNTDI